MELLLLSLHRPLASVLVPPLPHRSQGIGVDSILSHNPLSIGSTLCPQESRYWLYPSPQNCSSKHWCFFHLASWTPRHWCCFYKVPIIHPYKINVNYQKLLTKNNFECACAENTENNGLTITTGTQFNVTH